MSKHAQAAIAVALTAACCLALSPDSMAQSSLAVQAGDPDAGSSYLLRKSTLWYNRYFPGVFTHGAAYADLDRDGRIDVVVASGTGQDVRTPIRIMMNTGSGFADQTATRLSTAQPGLIHARKALAGDYNGDGWPDVFLVGHGYDQPPFPGEYPQLFLSNGDGTLRYDASLQAHVGFHHAAASGDIDGNGSIDIMVVQQGQPFFLVNDGAGHFTKDSARMPADVLYKNFFTGEMIDVDRDGHLDLLLGGHEFEAAYTTVYWGDATGAYSASRKTVLPEVPGKGIVMDFAAEDLDRDGWRDLVIDRTGSSPFYSGRALQILRQTAPRQFADETGARIAMDTSQGWIDFIRVQDINGDQAPDIFLDNANDQYNTQYAWTNDGSGVFANYAGAVKPAPTLSISDASTTEGLAGTKVLNFTVLSSQPVIHPLTFDAFTDNGMAVEGSDYDAAEFGDVAIAAGADRATIAVTVRGDGAVEGNESFTVNLASASGAMLADSQGVGRILNDDLAGLSIADAAVVEGASGQATARFEITLSSPMPTPVSFDIGTGNGSAAAGSDYVARSLVGRVFDAGRTRQVFEVNVHGDALAEPDETFSVTLSGVVGATLVDGAATGTISSDDAPAVAEPTRQSAATPARTTVLATGRAGAKSLSCAQLARDIAELEQRVAGRTLGERRGIARILDAERKRARLGCE